MRLLLDTHILCWSVDDPSKVSAAAMTAMLDPANDRLLSAATIWELVIKVGQGKMGLSMPFRLWMDKAIADLKLTILPVTVAYAERQSTLPPHHKDPFDRFMIAQALVEGTPIVGVDVAFDACGATRIWQPTCQDSEGEMRRIAFAPGRHEANPSPRPGRGASG